MAPEFVDDFVQVLAELRPYLSGTGGGGLELVEIDGYIVKIRLTGPAAGVMTVRVALTQKLRENIPSIGAVQLLEWPLFVLFIYESLYFDYIYIIFKSNIHTIQFLVALVLALIFVIC